jgi:hypothetical protein
MNWAVETAATQTKPASAGFKILIFRQSAQADFVCLAANSIRLGLKLTPMQSLAPLQMVVQR